MNRAKKGGDDACRGDLADLVVETIGHIYIARGIDGDPVGAIETPGLAPGGLRLDRQIPSRHAKCRS